MLKTKRNYEKAKGLQIKKEYKKGRRNYGKEKYIANEESMLKWTQECF
jgi:hypothetical protein